MATNFSRLRKYRKSARLSQRELSALTGMRSQSAISQAENGRKRPSLAVMMASHVVFDAAPAVLFPNLQADVERRVLANARRLHAHLQTQSRRKVASDHLGQLINRLANNNQDL